MSLALVVATVLITIEVDAAAPEQNRYRDDPVLSAAVGLSAVDRFQRAPQAGDGMFAGMSLLPGWQEAIAEAEPLQAFGARSTTRFHYGGGVGFDLDQDSPMLLGGVGWSYFVEDGLSIDLELNGMYFNQDRGDDALGINANVLIRWHFYREETWSIYGDGGAGIMFTTADVPAVGSSFNFTPQLGAGVSFDLEDNRRLMTGVRWHHVSNGSTLHDNDGRDSVYFYAMVSVPY